MVEIDKERAWEREVETDTHGGAGIPAVVLTILSWSRTGRVSLCHLC